MKPLIYQILYAIPLIASFKYDSRNYDKKDITQKIIKIYNKIFNIDMEYAKIKHHPTGGYIYETSKQEFLHSYEWTQDIANLRFPLPTQNEIRRAFPGLKLPKLI